MPRCQTMHHHNSLYFTRYKINKKLNKKRYKKLIKKLSNKKAEKSSAFLFNAISEINSAQRVPRQQTNGATYQPSSLQFGRNQQDAHLP